jgi:transmembrane 9 superfamily protein 1
MRGFIGQLEEGNILPHKHYTYIYTHYDFYFEYNEDRVCDYFFKLMFFINDRMKRYFLNKQIIFANVSTKERAPSKLDDVTAPIELTFTYSVTWEMSK